MEFSDIGKIFVKNMPESCHNCPFEDGYYDQLKCGITEREQEDYPKMKRMRGCPLKSMEEFKKISQPKV